MLSFYSFPSLIRLIQGNSDLPLVINFLPHFMVPSNSAQRHTTNPFLNENMQSAQVLPMENSMQKPNEANCSTWPTLGQLKQCYILIHCQVSKWWEDSHQSPKQLLKESYHPCHPQMWSRWQSMMDHLWEIHYLNGGKLHNWSTQVTITRNPLNLESN